MKGSCAPTSLQNIQSRRIRTVYLDPREGNTPCADVISDSLQLIALRTTQTHFII